MVVGGSGVMVTKLEAKVAAVVIVTVMPANVSMA